MRLVYFNIAAKAEPIRLALAYAGVPFEDQRLSFDEFRELKASGKLAFGQVPALVLRGGERTLVQSAAILRYVARVAAGRTDPPLYPEDAEAAAAVDAILDLEADMMAGMNTSSYAERFGFGDLVGAEGALRENLDRVRCRLHDEVLPRHLGNLSALLDRGGTGWLAGGAGPTIADFCWVSPLQRLMGRADGPPYGLGDGLSAGLVDRYPNLRALVDRTMALPAVREWYAGRGQQVVYHRVPRLGIGTFNNFKGEPFKNSDPDVRASVEKAISTGYRMIDCAEFYCNEASVGEAIAGAIAAGTVTRGQLFVVSKAWNQSRDAASLRAACERTLRALRVSYLDMYLIHWPICWTPESAPQLVTPGTGGNPVSITVGQPDPRGEDAALAEAWRGMEALVDAGLVRQIGVSNYGVARLRKLLAGCRIRPACDQVECHPHMQQRELLAFCKEQGIDMVAYHPIGKPNFRKEGQPVAIREDAVVAAAGRAGCTPAQALLAWHISRGVGVIPKSVTPARIEENWGARDVTLSALDVVTITALDANARFCNPAWMPSWD